MSKITALFEGRRVVVATMHGKEKVIGPELAENLGVRTIVPKKFNSDKFGTFSGEVERTLDILQTARLKCEYAMELTGCNMAIASEGSFGPHPTLFFAPSDDEFMLFIDKENKLEFWSRVVSTETNFDSKIIHSIDEAIAFAEGIDFPTHRLILRNRQSGVEFLRKGIGDHDSLEKYTAFALKKYGSCFLETDMRAMYNPKRMNVIKQATTQLIKKITSLCPSCEMPGFTLTKSTSGLACDQCGLPTASIKTQIHSCEFCKHIEEIHFPQGKKTEDAMYCNNCNP
jgi:hypothetical protein